MMVRSLWSAATGMHAMQKKIDSVANDLSNVNTNGYKRTQMSFADLYYQRLRAAGLQGLGDNEIPQGIQIGNGTRVTGTTKMFVIGSIAESDLTTNMAIVDGGSIARNFFVVDRGNGELAYTRDGSFNLDAEGNFVLPDGSMLNGGVQIPAEHQDVFISESGLIQYTDGTGVLQDAGQLDLATFANPAGLEPIGNNLFVPTPASGDAVTGTPGDTGFGTIRSGHIEVSNVNAIDEMVNLISAQRAYEFNSRSIQTSDEMLQTVNNLKR